MKSIEIDRSVPLTQEPHKGHNRFHPDIPPVLEIDEDEEVVFETRDSSDLQLTPQATKAVIDNMEGRAIHPLTGPVWVKGAQPGDLLEVEFLDILPERWGVSAIIPGLGFLRDLYTAPYLVHWEIDGGWATAPELPGVRIPGGPFMGISAVAPSRAQVQQWTRREEDLAKRKGLAFGPDPVSAVPSSGATATEGLRTIPPRENGGNFDVKQLTKGAKMLMPVFVEGALFSTGDGHFAQGDGEVCVNAVEMGATAAVRFHVLKGEAERRHITTPLFTREDYFIDPRWAAPQRFTATMGMPIRPDGTQDGEDLTLACRHALLQMIDLLQERGWTCEQAYIICSVAVDLKISNVVDVPNFVVTACLPEDIFEG